jgi:rhodanese-related sulfurtransferase
LAGLTLSSEDDARFDHFSHLMRRAFRDTILLLALAAIPAALAAWLHPGLRNGPTPPLAEHEITLTIALERPDTILWVDARGDEVFARGHIPGAISLEPSVREERMGELLERWTPETRIVVYCDSRSCDLSRTLAEELRSELGLDEVYFLRGGWEAWQEHVDQ